MVKAISLRSSTARLALPTKQGAKEQTWVPDNPRALLKRIYDENPNATETALRALLLEAVNRDPLKYTDGFVAYWFGPNFRSLIQPPLQIQKKKTLSLDAIAYLESKLLDRVLSNGKPLRACTFGEVAKESGWLKALSKLGKPSEIVGEKLTLDQVAAVWMPPASQ